MILIVAPSGFQGFTANIANNLLLYDLPCVQEAASRLDEIEDISYAQIVVSVGVPIGPPEMDRMPHLRAVVSPLLGYDWIDLDAASERGIAVCNSEVAENRDGMAEATIMLLLALLYRLHETEASLRENRGVPRIERHTLNGRTIGLIGYGGISKAVIDRLSCWGCRFLVYTQAAPDQRADVEFVTLEALLEGSDAVLILTSLNPRTHHMLGARELAMLRPGSLLVNTARGAIIEESALIGALASGRIAAAALDVFEEEPLRPDHPLRDIPNVILTPHAIGHNVEAEAAIPVAVAAQVDLLSRNAVPASCKNSGSATRLSGVAR